MAVSSTSALGMVGRLWAWHDTPAVGVDGSQRRVQVCAENAQRMGIANARFIHVPPGEALPLDTGTFDAVTAASSIE